jgi:GTP-binding protein LepA
VIARIPPPKGDPEAPLKALLIDSWFDNYVGVVMLVRVIDGRISPKDRIKLMATGACTWSSRSVSSRPSPVARDSLSAGGVGFIIAASRS